MEQRFDCRPVPVLVLTDLHCRCRVVVMFAGCLFSLSRRFAGLIVLVGMSSVSALANPIVDIEQHHPLGAITKDKTADRAYFSLGNGRAIQISLAGAKMDYAVLKGLSIRNTDQAPKRPFVKKRNLRW